MQIANIEQVKQEQAIFTDLWNIYKKYANISKETEWDDFIAEMDKLFNQKYKGSDKEKMFHEMLLTITNQLERNYKKKCQRDIKLK